MKDNKMTRKTAADHIHYK